jgi:phospholipid/cholesterol/gamma-HCH transport system substrate-binding protein
MSSNRRKPTAVATVLAVLVGAVIAGIGYHFLSTTRSITVTAQFDSAAGLYVDNTVSVLGMPVGRVRNITPRGSYVDVEFTVDDNVKIPADVHAVTMSTSILTARQIELTPPYHGGPVLGDHDTIGLPRTKTPVAFDRVLDMLDKISRSLKGDGAGGGPVADVLNAASTTTDGNGERIKSALDELSNALRLSADGGAQTADQFTTIIKDLSSLTAAAANNDAKLRQFGSTTHRLSEVLADEDLGSGTTGRTINAIIAEAAALIEKNRDHLKQIVHNGDTALKTLADHQRDLSEVIDVLPLTMENLYNTVDQVNGAVRVHPLPERLLADSQYSKEICNLMHLRQLGCSTGTLQDYGPDFGLTYVLDGLAAMGQK